jgi:hypothetical protein
MPLAAKAAVAPTQRAAAAAAIHFDVIDFLSTSLF